MMDDIIILTLSPSLVAGWTYRQENGNKLCSGFVSGSFGRQGKFCTPYSY